jgi:hypothetical protein
MQFKCDSGHLFHYPAKRLKRMGNMKKIQQALEAGKTAVAEEVEVSVCPFCLSKTFTEYVEPVTVADALEDMQLVEFTNVKAMVSQGYVELDRKDHVYAKGLIMLKTKPKIVVEQPDTDCAQAITEAAEKSLTETHP